MTVLRDALAVVVALAVVAAVVFALWMRHMIARHGALVMIGRWFAGHSLDGQLRTNATWSEPATKVLHPTGRAHPWHHMRRRNRVAIRAAVAIVLLATAYGLVTATTLTVVVLAVVAVLLLALYVAHLVYKVRYWHHERHYVRPLERSLIARVGAAPDTLAIEREGKTVTGVTIEWPAETEITTTEQDAALSAVTDRLAIEAPGATWNLKGRNRSVSFTQSEPPPAKVSLATLRAAIEGAGPNRVIVGQGRSNTSVPINLDNDSAHIAMSIGPGGGKTLAARALAIQVLYKGGLVIILNFKKSGYNWTRGLPNVAHAKTIEDIGDCLIWANTERNRREDIAEVEGDIEDELPDHVNVGPRILIIFEEQNLTVPKIKALRPDAFEALGDLNFAGRAARLNMLAIAQRYSAKAAGGGDVRAAVNARLLGRYDKDAWMMLAKAFPMPAPNSTPGRVQVVTDEVHEAQMPKVSGQEAHDFAVSGVVALCPSDMPCRCADGTYVPRSQLVNTGPEQRLVPGTGTPALPPRVLVGLRQATGDGVIDLSVAAVRKRQQRDPSFPPVRDHRGPEALFDLAELEAWEDNR